MDKEFVLTNALIVNEGRSFIGYIVIEPPYIAQIGEGEYKGLLPRNDMNGKMIIPGVIDTHVHFREPGLTSKGDIYSESRAAAAGGVTSYFDMPNCLPQTISKDALDDKIKIAQKNSLINYAFYIGVAKDNFQILKSIDYSKVPGIKLFLGSSTGGMKVDGDDYLDDIFSLPQIISVHSEDQDIIDQNVKEISLKYPSGNVPIYEHANIRSAAACYHCTADAVNRAKRLGTHLHVCHVSTSDELKFFSNDIPLKGKQVTSEVCVQHLWFNADDYTELGSRIKCNPSIKSESNRNALIQAVSNGTIDVVSTDHAPHQWSDKTGDALHAASGIPMIQFSLLAMLELSKQGCFSIEKVVELMCHNPASLFGIEKRGYLRPGYYADITVIDNNNQTKVTKDIILSKCKWSPYEGVTFSSSVANTYINGCCVYPFTDEVNGVSMLLKFRR